MAEARAPDCNRFWGPTEAEEYWRDRMKKFVMGIAGLIAMAAPVSAADLPARPYATAPAMIAAVYDWSGFYIGINGGWGSSRKCWDNVAVNSILIANEGCQDATGQNERQRGDVAKERQHRRYRQWP